MHDWVEVIDVSGSNIKANAYQNTLTQAIDQFFPLKTTRRRSDNLPWLDKKTIKMIERRKALFIEEGGVRTAVWKAQGDSRQEERLHGFTEGPPPGR